MSDFVLVKYEMHGTPITGAYNVMPVKEWERIRNGGRVKSGLLGKWEEITRGTQEEMKAVAVLMPEPRIIGVDKEES